MLLSDLIAEELKQNVVTIDNGKTCVFSCDKREFTISYFASNSSLDNKLIDLQVTIQFKSNKNEISYFIDYFKSNDRSKFNHILELAEYYSIDLIYQDLTGLTLKFISFIPKDLKNKFSILSELIELLIFIKENNEKQ